MTARSRGNTASSVFSHRRHGCGLVCRRPEGLDVGAQHTHTRASDLDVPCGFPANESDIEMRMEQGFSVFVMGWGDGGFRTIDVGRVASGR